MKEIDWIRWAELDISVNDAIISEAKKHGLRVFENDKPHDIFMRLNSHKNAKINKWLLYANIALTIISLISAATALLTLFKK